MTECYRFIHIPKNAGVSIFDFLNKAGIPYELGILKSNNTRVGTHRLARQFLKYKQNQTFIAVKRNPYSRIVSYYNYLHNEHFNPRNPTWNNISLKNFIENKIEKIERNIPSPWILQTEWMVDDQGKMLIDKLFSLENLETEIKEYFNLNVSLEKLNISHKLRNEDLDKNMKEIIYNHFKKDFEILGYEK